MDSTLNRPAVDVASDRPRPGVAFALALLSVPGTTIAWDLPAGGLWIGLPLAVAALVIGVRARRQLAGRSRPATAAILIAALALAQMAIYSVFSLVS
jgi:hypothetical protein